MSGRGDNNKKGSSGRGASNQSNQGSNNAEPQGKSNRGEQTGTRKSEPSPKTADPDSLRGEHLSDSKRNRK